uniref:RGS domain-containing protein n=1 Tax=Anopheles atroparvus TaxID=41427 RepID=A0A182J232_ANOAO
MLQFLKKTGRRKSITGGGSIDTSEVTDPAVLAHQRKFDDVINDVKLSENDDEVLCLAERYCFERRDSCGRVSKLSRRMSDILAEQSSMCFFVQYMESRNALSLVKFWLDVESFKAAAFESKHLKPVTGIVGHYFPTGLHRSVSSERYDTISYLSVECDAVSMNSCSENTFEDTLSTEDVREVHSLTSQSCTPVPATARDVVEEVDSKENICNAVGDAKHSMVQEKEVNQLEVCDIAIMRQSLTDDEKTQICEAGKGTSVESSSSAAPKTKCEESNVFNSLINSDAVRIYKKYLTINSPHYIEVPATALSTISLTLCSGACSAAIFNEVQQFLLELLERNYLNPFLESSFYCKYTLEVLTSENLTLVDILGSEMALFYFMEYLEQHKKRHYLECYVAAVNFKQSFENKIQAQKDAIVLYEKYFSLQATCSLKLSDSVRFKLEEQICSADPANIAVCFELPVQIIERFLEQRFFAGFIKSLLYTRFINELLGKVRTNMSSNVSGMVEDSRNCASRESGNKGHRKTLSDASSDRGVGVMRGNSREFKTISSHNTLLAMSDTNFKRNRKSLVPILHTAGTNMPSATGMSGSSGSIDIMQIDSRQLYNPDLLWRRNSPASGLTFGRVDALGRYERDFDIAGPPSGDDRWNRNKIKRAVRKLVNLSEDKAQEELAWQVAEMIVKDITSVTMNNKT